MAKDPSAMGLVDGAIDRSAGNNTLSGACDFIDHVDAGYSLAKRHARNVDKQRRRLLAEKVERKAHSHELNAESEDDRDGCRCEKLRALAARLRGEK